jgi:hypothetical protein
MRQGLFVNRPYNVRHADRGVGAVREPPIEGKELQYPRIKPYRTGWDNPYLLKVLQG